MYNYTNPYLSGNPYGSMYQPYQPNMASAIPTPAPQPQPAPTQVQQTPQQVNTNKIYVNGVNDVKARIQPASSLMIYFDNDNPDVMYQKSVDGTGHYEVQTFKVAEFKPEQETTQASAIDTTDFVKKDDLKPFVTADKFETAIKNLRADFSKGLEDMKKANIKKMLDMEE